MEFAKPPAGVEVSIQTLAQRFAGARLDARAYDRDDYANEMRLAAWRAAARRPHRPYIETAVWNCARDLARASARQVAAREPLEDEAIPCDLDKVLDLERVWVQTPEPDRTLIRERLDGASFSMLAKKRGTSDFTVRRHYQSAMVPVVDAIA